MQGAEDRFGRENLVFEPVVEDAGFQPALSQRGRGEDVVDELALSGMEDGVTTHGLYALFEGDERAGALLLLIVAAAQQPSRSVMSVGVEIAADGDAGVRIGVEQHLDEEPRLQRLAFTLLRGDELSLDLRFAGPCSARRGHRRGTWRPQMQIENMDERAVRHVDRRIEKRTVPFDRHRRGRRAIIAGRRPRPAGDEIMVDLP